VRASRGDSSGQRCARAHSLCLALFVRRNSAVRRQTVKKRTRLCCACTSTLRPSRDRVLFCPCLVRGVRRTLLQWGSCPAPRRLPSGFSSEPQHTTRQQESCWCARSCCDLHKISLFPLGTLHRTVFLYFFGLFELRKRDSEQNSVVRKTKIPMAKMGQTGQTEPSETPHTKIPLVQIVPRSRSLPRVHTARGSLSEVGERGLRLAPPAAPRRARPVRAAPKAKT
jgi:hypothetical protein